VENQPGIALVIIGVLMLIVVATIEALSPLTEEDEDDDLG
jgi:hypothetical protein